VADGAGRAGEQRRRAQALRGGCRCS
jgi:hypothetical protein